MPSSIISAFLRVCLLLQQYFTSIDYFLFKTQFFSAISLLFSMASWRYPM